MPPGTLPTEVPRPGTRGLVRVWWTTIVITGALLMALTPVVLVVLFIEPLLLLLMAIVLAQAMAPLVDGLRRWMPRLLAIFLLYGGLFVGVGLLLWLAFTPLVSQIQDLSLDLPAMIAQAQNWLAQDEQLQGFIPPIRSLVSPLQTISVRLIAVPIAAASLSLQLLVVFVLSIYWIIAMPRLERFTLSFFPRRQRGSVRDLLREMGQTMGGYLRGVGILMLLIGGVTYVGLVLIGVEYPLILAITAGLLEAIPIVGPVLAGVIIVGITLIDSFNLAVLAAIYFFIIQQIEGHILVPNIMRNQTNIPAPLVMVALLAGGSIGGLTGAIIAIPLAGALRIFFLRVITPAIRGWAGAEPMEDGGLRSEGD